MSFTVGAVWAGLQAGAGFAGLYGENDLAEKYRSVAAGIKAAAEKHLWDPQLGRFLRRLTVKPDGTINRDTTLDSSLYGLFAFGMFDADDERIVSTMEAVRAGLWCKTGVGGLARYENDYYYQVSQDVANVPGNPWFICTMWYAQWLVACAHEPRDLEPARNILEWVVKGAGESGVLAEQLDPYSWAPVSVAPLTWSHATVVSLVHDYLDKLAKINRALEATRRLQQAGQLRLATSQDEAAAS
jgi:GH15 family glucan-1,4-alpha-glucosidase